MNLYLRAWGNAWIKYTLDTVTGEHSWKTTEEPHDDDIPWSGLASIEPVFGLFRRFYAVFAFGGRLYFRTGAKKWDITDAEVETTYWCLLGLISGFSLILNGKRVHRVILVHPRRAMWPFIDPTYDGIDFDSDHFLFFLSEHLRSDEWKERVLSMEPPLSSLSGG